MTVPTKREAAEQVIENMTSEWTRLKDLAKRARLTKMEMARFLYEYDDVEKKLVYVGGCGASLQRCVYRKRG